jgi:hypothetical protein
MAGRPLDCRGRIHLGAHVGRVINATLVAVREVHRDPPAPESGIAVAALADLHLVGRDDHAGRVRVLRGPRGDTRFTDSADLVVHTFCQDPNGISLASEQNRSRGPGQCASSGAVSWLVAAARARTRSSCWRTGPAARATPGRRAQADPGDARRCADSRPVFVLPPLARRRPVNRR